MKTPIISLLLCLLLLHPLSLFCQSITEKITDLHLANLDSSILERYPLPKEELPVRIIVSIKDTNESTIQLVYHGKKPFSPYRIWTRKKDLKYISAKYISSDDKTVTLALENGKEYKINRGSISNLDNLFIHTAQKYGYKDGVLTMSYNDLNDEILKLADTYNKSKGFTEFSKNEKGEIIYKKHPEKLATKEKDRFAGTISYDTTKHAKKVLELKRDHQLDIYAIELSEELSFTLSISSHAKEWRYLEYRDTFFLVDGKRFVVRGNHMNYNNSVGSTMVHEHMSYNLHGKLLHSLLNCKSFDFKVGINEFSLTDTQIAMLKKIITEMKSLR